jgi:3-oxoadipate enol-lactonase
LEDETGQYGQPDAHPKDVTAPAPEGRGVTAVVAGMAVEVAGQGEAVILLHGLGGTSNTFQPLMEGLRGFRAVRPDLPGSGRSATPEGPLSVATLADGIARMAEVLGVDRGAHLVGHSLGTILCQHLAAERPAMVRSLTLFGALGEPPAPARATLRERAARARAGGMEAIADEVSGGSTAAATRRAAPAAVAFVRESLLRQCPRGYARTCEALSEARAADPARIACPLLVVNGEDDPVAPPSGARALAERIAGARAEILPRCGHWPTIEAPREAARALAGFLGGAARGRATGARRTAF